MFNLKLVDGGGPVELPDDTRGAAKFLAKTIVSSGRAPGQDSKIDWKDFADKLLLRDNVSISHIRPLIETSIQMILREPLEPMMAITGLFTRVETRGLEQRVIGGAIGAVYAEDVEEGGKYPEVMFQIGGGLQTAYIGKSGIAASFTDEALRYTTWDIMAINLRAMRNAIIRHKEQKAISFLRNMGTSLFDNLSPSTSLFGVATGRGLDMAANGSVTMDDIFKAMAHMGDEGFFPDVMLMNPQMHMLWVQDPVLRGMVMAWGGGTFFNQFSGTTGPLDPWSNGAVGAAGPTQGNVVIPTGNAAGETPTGMAGREHGMTSAPSFPSYMPWKMRIIVSPFVPFDPTTGLSDIYLLSSGNVGLLLVDENPVEVSWRDEDHEVSKVKIRERYGFHVANEGFGIGLLRNIPFTRNYWDGTIQATVIDAIEEIDPATDLSDVL
jgi:hypothetical protein